MSGGIAFVFDRYNNFAQLCNTSSIDLERVELPEDQAWLKEIIAEFQAKTDSILAGKMLNEWTICVKRFVKVFPKEFKRALAELEAERLKADEAKRLEEEGTV